MNHPPKHQPEVFSGPAVQFEEKMTHVSLASRYTGMRITRDGAFPRNRLDARTTMGILTGNPTSAVCMLRTTEKMP